MGLFNRRSTGNESQHAGRSSHSDAEKVPLRAIPDDDARELMVTGIESANITILVYGTGIASDCYAALVTVIPELGHVDPLGDGAVYAGRAMSGSEVVITAVDGAGHAAFALHFFGTDDPDVRDAQREAMMAVNQVRAPWQWSLVTGSDVPSDFNAIFARASAVPLHELPGLSHFPQPVPIVDDLPEQLTSALAGRGWVAGESGILNLLIPVRQGVSRVASLIPWSGEIALYTEIGECPPAGIPRAMRGLEAAPYFFQDVGGTLILIHSGLDDDPESVERAAGDLVRFKVGVEDRVNNNLKWQATCRTSNPDLVGRFGPALTSEGYTRLGVPNPLFMTHYSSTEVSGAVQPIVVALTDDNPTLNCIIPRLGTTAIDMLQAREADDGCWFEEGNEPGNENHYLVTGLNLDPTTARPAELLERIRRHAEYGIATQQRLYFEPTPTDDPADSDPAPAPQPSPRPARANGGLSLAKGGNVSLTKSAPELASVTVGLGWDAATAGTPIDLDASALALGADRNVLSDLHFVFFNNLSSPDGSIAHRGDNLTGDGDGDDEQIAVDLRAVPPNIETIVFTASIYEATERGHSFGTVRNAYIRVVDDATGAELARFDLTDAPGPETAMLFGELYRRGTEWKFRAVGQGYADGLVGIAKDFGVHV